MAELPLSNLPLNATVSEGGGGRNCKRELASIGDKKFLHVYIGGCGWVCELVQAWLFLYRRRSVFECRIVQNLWLRLVCLQGCCQNGRRYIWWLSEHGRWYK